MRVERHRCCVLNSGSGAWAFESLAKILSTELGVDTCDRPRDFNYLLGFPDAGAFTDRELFIPLEAINAASDKRELVRIFRQHSVPTPETLLVEGPKEAKHFARSHRNKRWCVKYPISCGGTGHFLLTQKVDIPPTWPRPIVLQEFIELQNPEVYRVYCAAGELFGWNVRRFAVGDTSSPWVAHARGAQYFELRDIPNDAAEAARLALSATKLLDSFGCADLLYGITKKWMVIEVGTDGLHSYVDRDLGIRTIESALSARVSDSFWSAAKRSLCSG